MKNFDELQLSKDLIRFPSVTPLDAGAINYLSKKLKQLGFNCKVLEFKDKKNTNFPSLSCAVIIKQVDEKTRSKTSINDLLRE